MSGAKPAFVPGGVRFGILLLAVIATGGAAHASDRALGDMDADGDVDMADYARLQACYGLIESPPGEDCPVDRLALLDVDGDGGLDYAEFEQFAACMSGPNQPVPPECLQPPLAVSILGASSAEDGHSVDLVAAVSGAVGEVLYEWQIISGSAVLDDPSAADPTLWMTANQNVLVEVTVTDGSSNGITIDMVVDQHAITAVPHPQYTFEVFAGGNRVLTAGSTNTIDLFGAYFDPAACQQQAIYWEWDAVSIPFPEGGWFDKPHRLGTPSEPVRFTPLGSWVPGDYVFSLFAHNSCSGLEDQDTVVVTIRLECQSNAECDDSLFCDGQEVCNPENFCESGVGPCVAGQACDEINDQCEPICFNSGDCDDGLFCNGQELCRADGLCQPGTDPCPPGQFCDEASTSCAPPIDQTFTLTVGQDAFLGGPGDDVLNGPIVFNPGSGEFLSTLQSFDTLDGAGGNDRLNANLINETGSTLVITPTISGIETLSFSNFGAAPQPATTISGLNVTGVAAINSVGSLANVTVNNINTLTDLGVTNSDSDLIVTYTTPAGNGSADSNILTLNGARDSDQDTDGGGADIDTAGSTVNITTPANGLEALSVQSIGATGNTLEALMQTTGTTLLTINVEGSAPFTVRRLAPLPGTLTNLNCANASGGTDLTLGGATNLTYTGGSGNDVINFAGSYTSGDIINGGGGTNTLGVNSAQAVSAVTNQANVTNIQTILIPDSLNGALDVTRFGATDAILDTTAVATNLLSGNSTISLGSGNRTLTLNNDDTGANLGVTVPGAGLSDALTLNLQNADLGGTLTITGAESVNLVSGNGSDGTASDGDANTATAITVTPTLQPAILNIQGPVAFTLTGTITAATINAAAAGAGFTMGAATVSVGATITGSTFNDTLIGSASADAIFAGDGNDAVRGEGGADPIITLGSGADILRITALGASGVDRKMVTDFNDGPGAADILSLDPNVGGGNASLLSGTDNFTSSASIQNHGVAGSILLAGATEVVRVTASTVTNFTDANSLNGTNLLTAIGGGVTVQATSNQHLFVVADASGNEGVYYGDAGADNNIVAGELTLIAVLQGPDVALADLVFQNFANN